MGQTCLLLVPSKSGWFIPNHMNPKKTKKWLEPQDVQLLSWLLVSQQGAPLARRPDFWDQSLSFPALVTGGIPTLSAFIETFYKFQTDLSIHLKILRHTLNLLRACHFPHAKYMEVTWIILGYAHDLGNSHIWKWPLDVCWPTPSVFRESPHFWAEARTRPAGKARTFWNLGQLLECCASLFWWKKGVFKVGDPRDIGFHDENDHPWRLPPWKSPYLKIVPAGTTKKDRDLVNYEKNQ